MSAHDIQIAMRPDDEVVGGVGNPISLLRPRPASAPAPGEARSSRATVLHVLEALAGGTSRHLVDLVRHTPSVRHVVAVPRRRVGAVPDDLALPALAAAGADVRLVEMRRRPFHPRNGLAYLQLTRLVRELRPDIIHGHSAIGGALARAVPAPPGTPRIYTPNGLNQSRVAVVTERALASRTTRLVAVSRSEERLLQDLELCSAERSVFIRNCLALPETTAPAPDLRTLAGFPPHVPVVGSVARLLPQKAPERFVQCARMIAQQNSDARFLLIGDGPLAAQVDREAARPELAGRFVRLREVQGVARSLGQLDVFVLLSRFEGGPYSPLEAMAAGTPAVLSDAVGNVDTLQECGVSELLVRDGDPAQAADVVLRLLNDSRMRNSLGETVSQRVIAAFDIHAMGREYMRLYAELAPPDVVVLP